MSYGHGLVPDSPKQPLPQPLLIYHQLNAQGPISVTIFPSEFKCDGNLHLLSSRF